MAYITENLADPDGIGYQREMPTPDFFLDMQYVQLASFYRRLEESSNRAAAPTPEVDNSRDIPSLSDIVRSTRS